MGKRKAYVVAGLGLEMLLSPVIGLMAGSWLDEKFGTKPWLLMAGLMLGVASAVKIGAKIFRIGMKAMNQPPEGNENAD